MNIRQLLHQYFYPFYIRRWAERFFKVGSGRKINMVKLIKTNYEKS